MRRQLTHFARAIALGAFLTASLVAQEKASPRIFTAEQLTEPTLHRRAMEAIIWGIPVVNYDLMFQSILRDAKGETHALIRGMSRPSLASNDTTVQKNADSSTDIYFGPSAPAGKESNWVPTDPKGKFELLFRLYGPKKEFFEMKWKLPDVEEVK